MSSPSWEQVHGAAALIPTLLQATPSPTSPPSCPMGAPHSTPVYVGTRGDHIVLFAGPTMREVRNLRRDPRRQPAIRQDPNAPSSPEREYPLAVRTPRMWTAHPLDQTVCL